MVVKYIARTLSILWLLWWFYSSILFYIPDGMDAVLGNPREFFAIVIFAISVGVAWRFDIIGGIWLLLEGLISPVYFKLSAGDNTVFIFMSLIAPILLGVLFLVSWKFDQKDRVKHYSHTPEVRG